MKPTFAPALVILATIIPNALMAENASDKLTIEPGAFVIRETFTARAFPSDPIPVTIAAESWSGFRITDITPHGASVSEGDVLISFDGRELHQRIEDLEKAVARREHEIATATLELANLRETADERLDAARRAAEEAANDYEYYVETRHPIDVEASEQSVKRAKQRLLSTNEELVQLKRMYEEDDIVEETEEMILTRQRDSVEAAQFALRMEKLQQERRVGTTLPRHIESLRETKKQTARALATAKQEIPRAVTLKQAAVEEMTTTQARETDTLAKLKTDREFLEITAPADGTFYHGAIENGEWTTGELLRQLVIGGRPPVQRQIATFIPEGASIEFHAHLEEAVARSIGTEKPSGLATLTGRGDISIPVTVSGVSPVPTPAGRHHAVLTAEWPQGPRIAPGASAEVHLITYSREDAILVPADALEFGPDGWEIEIKLADGKTEMRNVTRGRSHNDRIEILDGLEAGQVIVMP